MNMRHGAVSFRNILLLSICALLVGCGGGGGSDGVVDKGDTLGTYDFNLSILEGYPLEIVSNEDTMISIEPVVEGGNISGIYDLDNDTITLDPGPRIKATTNLWGEPTETMWMNFNTDIVSVDGDHPTDGTVVDLENTDETQVQYSWEEFEELFWNDDYNYETWERQASCAYYVINFMFYQVRFVKDALLLIEENDTVLPAQSVTIDGDTFTGTPPNGWDETGSLVLSCTSGDAGPGSDFREVFNDFWMNDEDDSIDTLYDGTVNFVGFLEDSDDARDVITAIGFVPNSEEDPGGVFFDEPGLTVYETEETSPGVFSDETPSYTITGRYSIMFFEPDE